jgi:aryl carrier-like protein
LVDENESLRLLSGSNSLVTHGVLELDNLLQLGVDESSLRLDELFSLFRRRVEEARVDLAEMSRVPE